MIKMVSKCRCRIFITIFFILCYLKFNDAENRLPLVINTWAFREANEAAWLAMRKNGNALDSLVKGLSTCEDLQCDGTVGYGGSPNENGETTLDAMIMDGSNMNIGAVAGLREIKYAARVARLVLEHTKHTLLVGDSASEFAEMMGFQRESLQTAKSKKMWRDWQENKCQPNFWLNVLPDPKQQCGPYVLPEKRIQMEKYKYNANPIDRYNHDTIGMIVIDDQGHIFAGTSTNGARFKIPGRVGDSPIPGAGGYADNNVGAAVATGDGDVMMRFLPSLLAVEFLRNGFSTEESGKKALERILSYYPDFSGALVVVNKLGGYSAACAGMEKFPFSVSYGNSYTTVEYKNCINYDGTKTDL